MSFAKWQGFKERPCLISRCDIQDENDGAVILPVISLVDFASENTALLSRGLRWVESSRDFQGSSANYRGDQSQGS
jgi:hypothetical protein